MIAGSELDAPRALVQPGLEERLAVAFGTADGSLCGLAELAVQSGSRGEREVGGHALLFSERQLVSSSIAPPSPAAAGSWEETSAGGIRVSALESPGRWALAYRDQGGSGFELEFEPVGPPAQFGPETAFAQAAEVEGFEELGRVTGTVTVPGRSESLEGRGQRGRSFGRTDLGGARLTRRLGVWLEDETGLVLWAARPRRASAHDTEAVTAFLVEAQPRAVPDGDGASEGGEAEKEGVASEEIVVAAIDEARLSTTYDRDRHPLRAGLELWPSEEAQYPRRIAGDAICTASLDLDPGRVEGTFLAWHMEGRSGIGCYELRRPA